VVAWLIGALVLPMVNGCAHVQAWKRNGFKVGPAYRRPAVAVADHWIDFNSPQVISSLNGADNRLWWQVFQDPYLDGLVQSAYEQNLTLQEAGQRVVEADFAVAIAVGNLFPQSQQAYGAHEWVQNSLNGNRSGRNDILFRSVDLVSTGFRATWELDFWGRYRRIVESAEADRNAAIEAYDDVLVSLIADTVSTYIEIRGFQQRLAYAKQNIAIQEDSLRLAQVRFSTGDAERIDVTQALSNLAQTRALVPELERGLRQATNRLCILQGQPPVDLQPALGSRAIPTVPPQIVVGIPADLIRRRPDIRQAERLVAAQSARIGVAAADLLPSFSISGFIGLQANDWSDLFAGDSVTGILSPGFSWDILNYGRLRNRVRVEESRFQQLALAYQQVVLDANQETEDAIVAFLEYRRQGLHLIEGTQATAESVELARTKYNLGSIDFNRVNDLQRTLVLQQDELATVQTEAALSLVRVYRSLGGGWQIRHGVPTVEPLPAVTDELPPVDSAP
jgi:NodT family efflux transporter outer membrane factor (OMF) lipoprotein